MAANQNDATEMVRVYEMVSPDHLLRFERQLREVFVDALQSPKISQGDFYFSIDEKSGWIAFKDRRSNTLTSGGPPMLPSSEESALVVVKEAYARLLKSLRDQKRYTFLKAIGPCLLLPTQINPVDVVAVPQQKGEFIDHLLCRFQPILPATEQDRKGKVLLGAQVDVRIGHQGRIISLVSRWSPLTGKFILRPAVQLDQILSEETSAHAHSAKGEGYEMVYVQDNYHKKALAPFFYGKGGGHHGGFLPATDHSLLLAIGKEVLNGRLQCHAFVVGGSGKYSFQWYGWRPDTIFVEEGVHDLGNQPSVFLTFAVWNLVLVVEDLQFGITAEYQEMIYPTTISESPTKESTHA